MTDHFSRGEDYQPREWVYCWYARSGKTNIQQWARNQRYKLYPSGELDDISQDMLEKTPLVELPPEAQQARATLQQVLDHYKDALRAPAAPGKKKKTK